jgi:hypothetical protein
VRDVKFVVVVVVFVVAGVAVVGVIAICTVTILALRTLERQRRKAIHFAMGGWCFDGIHTVCFTNLDQGSEMIIFESILTIFWHSSFLEATRVVAKICLRLKSSHYNQI